MSASRLEINNEIYLAIKEVIWFFIIFSSQSWYFLSPINREKIIKKTFKMLMRWMERQRWEAIQKGRYYSVFGSVPIRIMKSHSHISSTRPRGCLIVWDSVIGFWFWTQIQWFGWLNWLDQLTFALVLALLKLFIKFSPIMYHNILYYTIYND